MYKMFGYDCFLLENTSTYFFIFLKLFLILTHQNDLKYI